MIRVGATLLTTSFRGTSLQYEDHFEGNVRARRVLFHETADQLLGCVMSTETALSVYRSMQCWWLSTASIVDRGSRVFRSVASRKKQKRSYCESIGRLLSSMMT